MFCLLSFPPSRFSAPLNGWPPTTLALLASDRLTECSDSCRCEGARDKVTDTRGSGSGVLAWAVLAYQGSRVSLLVKVIVSDPRMD